MKALFKWFAIVLVFALSAEANARTIGLRIPATTGVVGTNVSVPVNADTSFTGSNVVAFELTFTYSASQLRFDTIVTTGTLTAGWSNITIDKSVSGRIRIVGANATALSGSGVLFNLRFFPLTAGYSYVNFDAATCILNEGTPVLKLTYGTVQISQKPTISVSPNSAVITKGDNLQFYVSGGTSPYTWSVTNPSVASINSSGLLTATAKGFTRVVASDNTGIVDTSDMAIEIRGLKLYMRDTAIFENHTLLLPIYTTDLSVLNIKSGSVTLGFNSNLTPTGIIKTGGILNAASDVQFFSAPGSNQCTFSFAGSTALSGSGIFCYIQFETLRGGSYVSVSNALFNEDILANSQSCYVNVKTLPVLYISPAINTLQVGATQQFSASNGTAPYTWSTSDTTLATIASDGTLTALKSGSVKVMASDVNGSEGETGYISLYAANLSIHDTTVNKFTALQVPVYLENYIPGNEFKAFQFDIAFDTTLVKITGTDNTGSLSKDWSIAGNQVGTVYKVAGANTQPIGASGVLVYLQVQLKGNMYQNQTTYLQLNNIILNEGLPLASFRNGYLKNASPDAIQTLKDDSRFGIYPNPNNGNFTFDNKTESNLTVTVVNRDGKIIGIFFITGSGPHSLTLNAPAGEYIAISRSDKGQTGYSKLVLVR